MEDEIDVRLILTRDQPNSMNFSDTYQGLDDIWYKFESDKNGNILLCANEEGFEHLARFFLKLARGSKSMGYHSHHTLEFGATNTITGPQLTIALAGEPFPSRDRT